MPASRLNTAAEQTGKVLQGRHLFNNLRSIGQPLGVTGKRMPAQTSRGRGTGFARPQAQQPPREAGSHTQWATVGA